MAIISKNKNLYHISDIHITNRTLSWENHTLRVPGITRVWAGNIPPPPFPAKILLILLFLTLSSPRPINFLFMAVVLAAVSVVLLCLARPGKTGPQVHVEMESGTILSFFADEESTAGKFYESLKLAVSGHIGSEITIDSDGNITEIVKEAPEHHSAVTEIPGKEVQQTPLLGELQKLSQSITKKSSENEELLHLIDETSNLVKKGDREGLKQVFEKFITSGLIGDCNELGLETLIQEIKGCLY